jgi:hypothetical protein
MDFSTPDIPLVFILDTTVATVNALVKKRKKVKLSRYRPEQAHGDPVG